MKKYIIAFGGTLECEAESDEEALDVAWEHKDTYPFDVVNCSDFHIDILEEN